MTEFNVVDVKFDSQQQTKRKPYVFPLTRYHISGKYYILVFNLANKAEILKVTNPKLVNDFLLGAGMKTVKTFEADTPRKAYFKAKRKLLKILGESF